MGTSKAGNGALRARMAAILVLAAAPRVWAAVWNQGIFWPDEIFQSTEPAHTFAFGYGYVAWEFAAGARSWLFPGVLGLLWKVLAALGVSGAAALIISAKLAMVALALAGIYAAMRVAEKLGGAEAAVMCGILSAAFPPSIVYGSRCLTEMASGPLIAIAVLLLLDHQRWKLVMAGCLAALVIFLRYQNMVVTLALLGWLLAQRRGRDAIAYAAGAAMIGLAGGLLDLFTWGAPFHSLLTYLRFNFVQTGFSTRLGVEPRGYYLEVAWSAIGPSLLALAIGLGESVRRAGGLVVVVLLYVLAYTLVPHKEFRYMMPVLPLAMALSGVGLTIFISRFLGAPLANRARGSKHQSRSRRTRRSDRHAGDRSRDAAPAPDRVRPAIWVVAGALAAAMGWRAAYATFDDFGQRYGPLSGAQSVWHGVEAVNRLLWAAGQRTDLCGLAMVGIGPIWTGGYTYLHRDVPIVWMTPIDDSATNYVLTAANVPLPAGYTVVESMGEAKLARRAGTCAPPPDSYTRVFPKLPE